MMQFLSIVFALFIGSCITCVGIILLARICVWWEEQTDPWVNDDK
jgi:hypothetical protein